MFWGHTPYFLLFLIMLRCLIICYPPLFCAVISLECFVIFLIIHVYESCLGFFHLMEGLGGSLSLKSQVLPFWGNSRVWVFGKFLLLPSLVSFSQIPIRQIPISQTQIDALILFSFHESISFYLFYLFYFLNDWFDTIIQCFFWNFNFHYHI